MLFYAVFCVLSVGFGNARVGKDNFVHGPGKHKRHATLKTYTKALLNNLEYRI